MAREPKPKKQRWYHQIWNAYKMTRATDPAVTWWMLGAFAAVVLLGVILGLVTHNMVFWLGTTIPFGFLAAMFMLTRRAERAAYTRIAGQPGAARAAMGTVRGGWTFEDDPVAVSPRTQDMVFRGIGRPGVVLVSEGPPGRAAAMLAKEEKRTARVVGPEVPVTLIQCGDAEGQVPLTKLGRSISKLKHKLTKAETEAVVKRMRALGGAKIGIPKGVDPMKARPDRKAMRGR
ncbi:MAG: DUF4191 domain-containing protein [Cellulomonadaceae bacterium]|jgi:hypothetical protein|nr:DUF4191 domain-containing protein [Cellulomonadaceae bacterium]